MRACVCVRCVRETVKHGERMRERHAARRCVCGWRRRSSVGIMVPDARRLCAVAVQPRLIAHSRSRTRKHALWLASLLPRIKHERTRTRTPHTHTHTYTEGEGARQRAHTHTPKYAHILIVLVESFATSPLARIRNDFHFLFRVVLPIAVVGFGTSICREWFSRKKRGDAHF